MCQFSLAVGCVYLRFREALKKNKPDSRETSASKIGVPVNFVLSSDFTVMKVSSVLVAFDNLGKDSHRNLWRW